MDHNPSIPEYPDFPVKPTASNGVLRIDISFSRLQTICDAAAWRSGAIRRRYRVVNPEAAAADFIAAMTEEEEDGTTLLDEFFDRVVKAAIDDGPLGIEEDPTRGDDDD